MAFAQVGMGLLALAGVFAVLGIAGSLLTPVVPTLLVLQLPKILFGIAAVAVGVGVLAFSAGLAALATSGVAGATAIRILYQHSLVWCQQYVQVLVDALVTFAKLIAEAAPAIGQAFTAIFWP